MLRRTRVLLFLVSLSGLVAQADAQDVGFEMTQPEAAQAAAALQNGRTEEAEKLLTDAIKAGGGIPRRGWELQIALGMIRLRADKIAKAREAVASLGDVDDREIAAMARVMQEACRAAPAYKGGNKSALMSQEGWHGLLRQVRDNLAKKLQKEQTDLIAAAKIERWSDVGKLRDSSLKLCEQVEAVRLPGVQTKVAYQEQSQTLANAVGVVNDISDKHESAARNLDSEMDGIVKPRKEGAEKRRKEHERVLTPKLKSYNAECEANNRAIDIGESLATQYRDLKRRHGVKVANDKQVGIHSAIKKRPKQRAQP